MKDTFVLYAKYIDSIEYLTREERGDLLTALLAYSANRDLPEMDGATKAAYGFIKTQMDIDSSKYEERCEKNKENAGKKRKKATSKHSVAIGSDRKRSVAIGSDGKRSCCDSDCDSDSDYESDSDTDALKKQSTKEKSAIADEEKSYYPDEKLNEAFKHFVENRKSMKKPMSDYAISLAIKHLNDLSGGDSEKAIRLVNDAIEHSWMSFYPPKEDARSGTTRGYFDRMDNRVSDVDNWTLGGEAFDAK